MKFQKIVFLSSIDVNVYRTTGRVSTGIKATAKKRVLVLVKVAMSQNFELCFGSSKIINNWRETLK